MTHNSRILPGGLFEQIIDAFRTLRCEYCFHLPDRSLATFFDKAEE
jgi:transposase